MQKMSPIATNILQYNSICVTFALLLDIECLLKTHLSLIESRRMRVFVAFLRCDAKSGSISILFVDFISKDTRDIERR